VVIARPQGARLVLLLVAGACWAVTVHRMQGMDMGPGTDLGSLGWFAVVWVTMMAAMMLPSLSPMAAAYAYGRHRRAWAILGAIVFAAGYLLAWAGFGLLAYGVFEGVKSLDLGFLTWHRAGQYIAGGVVLMAALYELTPVKANCLRHCRDARLLRHRPGPAGALVAGLEQGGFCVGCSGAMMLALLALGVMSVAWMVLIAVLVTIEKLLPWQAVPTGASAVVLALLGAGIVLAPEHVPWLTIPMHA